MKHQFDGFEIYTVSGICEQNAFNHPERVYNSEKKEYETRYVYKSALRTSSGNLIDIHSPFAEVVKKGDGVSLIFASNASHALAMKLDHRDQLYYDSVLDADLNAPSAQVGILASKAALTFICLIPATFVAAVALPPLWNLMEWIGLSPKSIIIFQLISVGAMSIYAAHWIVERHKRKLDRLTNGYRAALDTLNFGAKQ